MHGEFADGVVRVGGDARQRFYDSRGYGRPLSGNEIELAPVEAAHLLVRGDLDGVVVDGDALSFEAFFEHAAATTEGFDVRFLVYADLRGRGFYLSPAREGWVADPEGADLIVYPRGKGPADDAVAHRMRVVGEGAAVPLAALGETVLAVVDEESEITYLDTERRAVTGRTDPALSERVEGTLLGERVVCWDPPAALYERGFFGQPLGDDAAEADVLQLSLVEAAYLAERGVLAIEGGADAVRERGRAVEGERFDRRDAAYAALRSEGVVPKTGFKFGADFRTYAGVEDVESLGHSELLVRVLPPDHRFRPRELALDVRLAHGVRKTMVFAGVADDGAVEWTEVTRLTP